MPTQQPYGTTPRKKTELEQLISDIHGHNINHHTREIYVHGAYSEEEPGVDFRMGTTFVKNMHILDSQKVANILIHMHTIGGDWDHGMAMFWAIRFAKSPVTILAHSHASSMSGILLQAADNRVIMPDCNFMIHHGSIYVNDDSIAVKSAVDVNNRLCKRMLHIFARRAILGRYFKERDQNEEQIMRFMDRKIKDKRDWFLTAEEAVDFGFADGIFGEKGYEDLRKIRINRKCKVKF